METRIVVTALVLIAFVTVSSPATAPEPNSFAICKHSGTQTCPAVSGTSVVWQDNRISDYDIYRNNPANLKDPNSFLVCSETRDQKLPAISGSTVVWQDARMSNTNTDIFRYSLPGGPETGVCTYAYKQEAPAISGNIIVWQDDRNSATKPDIYGYSSATGEFLICDSAGPQSYPAISGNIVVWQDNRSGIPGGDPNNDIYGKYIDSGTEFFICKAAGSQTNPAISGDIVVWEDHSKGDSDVDIYGYRISTHTTFPICTEENSNQINPAVSGDIVVWEDYRVTDHPHIYGYRISTHTVFPICTLTATQMYPAVSGNLVVWQDTRNDAGDIYGAYIPEPVAPSIITITVPNGGETLPAGSKYMIRWNTSGTIGHVKIEDSNDNGRTYSIIDANVANNSNGNSEYLWTLPADVNSDQCRIRISDKDNADTTDISNNVFTIFKCSAALTADLDGDCAVDFTDFAIFSRQWLTCGNLRDPQWCQ